MRRIASIALLLLVFSGSVGVPLYTHTCFEEKVTIRTFFTASEHCEDMASAPHHEAHSSCCAAPEQQVKDNCCSEEAKHLAMKFGFFEQWQLQLALAPQLIPEVTAILPYVLVFPDEREVLYATNSDPPPLSGKDILHRICIWRL